MSWFAEHCPRLARARDEYVRIERRKLASLASARLRLERLVAHRELQLVRAQRTGDGRYIARRTGKLERAREALARLGGQA